MTQRVIGLSLAFFFFFIARNVKVDSLKKLKILSKVSIQFWNIWLVEVNVKVQFEAKTGKKAKLWYTGKL